MERWLSGLKHTLGKRAHMKICRGFESSLFRISLLEWYKTLGRAHNSIPIVSSSLLSHLYHIFNLPNNINYFSYAINSIALKRVPIFSVNLKNSLKILFFCSSFALFIKAWVLSFMPKRYKNSL